MSKSIFFLILTLMSTYSFSQVPIKSEVLIMIGDDNDNEGMDLEEVVRVKKSLPKSDLWILPNVAHGAHEGGTKGEFIIKSKAFLSKK
jgi:hypothetical protein